MPRGPRCLKCKIVSPSRPGAVDEPEALMALRRSSGVKGVKLASIGWFLQRRRFIRLDSLLLVEGQEVNCLQKANAIAFLEVKVRFPKVMYWFGA